MSAEERRILPHHSAGPPEGAPIVLLHGFGGDRLAWATVQPKLAEHHPTVAFDLPGHGQALDWPGERNSSAAVAALTASFEGLGIERAHLVGHSMGGALAILLACASPDRVASLTLLSPAGVGEAVNKRLIERFAAATKEHDITLVFENFLGPATAIPDGLVPLMAEVRSDPAVTRSFEAIAATLFEGETQKLVPVADLAEAACPVKVVWGDRDAVVPLCQIERFPPNVARHVLPGVGHIPHLEAEALVIRLILENVAAAARSQTP